MFRLLVAGILAMIARGAVVPEPAQFYTVPVFFSDNGALFYYRIPDVRQDWIPSCATSLEKAVEMHMQAGKSHFDKK